MSIPSSSSPDKPFIQQINMACEQIVHLKEKYSAHKQISEDVEKLIKALQDCNASIEGKQFSLDPEREETESINRLLQALQLFPFSAMEYDHLARANLKIGVFATLIRQFNTLDENLKKLEKDLIKWRQLKRHRVGGSVEKSSGGAASGGHS